jgi:hypothetical protein
MCLTNEEKALITREVLEDVAAVDDVEIVIRERKSRQQIYPPNARVAAVKINVCPVRSDSCSASKVELMHNCHASGKT